MSLKDAALFATVGMVLLTVVLLLAFTRDISSVLRGLLPALQLVVSAIHLLASLSVTAFFYVFHRAQ